MLDCMRTTFSLKIRRAVAVCLLCGASAAPTRGQSVETETEKHFNAARVAQNSGLLDEAAQEYQQALKWSPGIAEIYASLGLVYYSQAKFGESAATLSKSEQLKPGLNGVSLWLGVDYIKLGSPDKAIRLLREAVRRAPTDVQAQRWLGTALWNSGQRFPAIDQLSRTTELFPSDIDSYFVLGEAYRKAADDETEAVLASAVGTPLVHQIYGDIYKDQQDWVRASAHYREAIKLDPSVKGAHVGRGEIDLAQNLTSEAVAECKEELAVNPTSVKAKALIAEADLLEGDTTNALAMLEQAIGVSPYETLAAFHFLPLTSLGAAPAYAANQHLQKVRAELQSQEPSAKRSLALAVTDRRLGLPTFAAEVKEYKASVRNTAISGNAFDHAVEASDRGDFKTSELQLRAWLSQHPNDLMARYLSARVLKSLSLETLDRMVTIDPESPRVHQMLGQIYADRQEEDKALAEYRLVEHAQPTLPGIHYEIGHLLWQFGDRSNALDELNRELSLNPFHAEANGEIGSILVVQNQPEKAIPYLETALRIDPSLLLVHQQLGKAYAMEKNYSKAEEELRKAAVNDVDGSAHYQLWVIYRAQGRSEEASKAIAECRKIRTGRLEDNQNDARGTTTP